MLDKESLYSTITRASIDPGKGIAFQSAYCKEWIVVLPVIFICWRSMHIRLMNSEEKVRALDGINRYLE